MRPSLLLLLLVICGPLFGQEQEDGEQKEHERHEFGLLLSHTHIGRGLSEGGGNKWIVMPSWGLNYNYWFSERWAIGLHTDLINANFAVEEFDGETVLERERPVATALMATYRPHHHWSFLLGGGMEFAPGDDLVLVRAGTEYTVHLSGEWETCGSLAYDFRIDAYDSWTLGIGLIRLF